MKEKIKKIIIILIPVSLFFLIGSFIVDLGINSNFFIKRDFNQAFIYRVTGDCNAFIKYLSSDIEKWKERCEEEKNLDSQPIRNFQIQNVSHQFGSDRAFLQAELTRMAGGKDYSYSVAYEMKKIGFSWKIDQELRK